jgi:SPP1 family predicted phage head-tail adaptor
MRIGKLSKRVTLIEYITTSDGAGGTTAIPTDLLETWANITPVRGQRLFEYNKIIQGSWYDVTLRFREAIPVSKKLALGYQGRHLTIHSVLNKDEKRRVLTATAYEHD